MSYTMRREAPRINRRDPVRTTARAQATAAIENAYRVRVRATAPWRSASIACLSSHGIQSDRAFVAMRQATPRRNSLQ